MGNQQYTASGLNFINCQTALQIHWDWGWTIQNVIIINVQTGVTIVGGAGGVRVPHLTLYWLKLTKGVFINSLLVLAKEWVRLY
jgi:hypothetical protein